MVLRRHEAADDDAEALAGGDVPLSLQHRKRKVIRFGRQLRKELAGTAGNCDVVPVRTCSLGERYDDALGAAGTHLLDYVEDPHSSSYSSIVEPTARSTENSAAMRAAPQAPRRTRSSGSPASRSIAAASSAGSSGATSKPVPSSPTSSGIPPTRVAITGRPEAIA